LFINKGLKVFVFEKKEENLLDISKKLSIGEPFASEDNIIYDQLYKIRGDFVQTIEEENCVIEKVF
jgi:hypothetical protein